MILGDHRAASYRKENIARMWCGGVVNLAEDGRRNGQLEFLESDSFYSNQLVAEYETLSLISQAVCY
jgi:hypothetical protein